MKKEKPKKIIKHKRVHDSEEIDKEISAEKEKEMRAEIREEILAEEDEKLEKEKKKRRRRTIVLIILIIIILILIFWWHINLPSRGTLNNVCQMAPQEEAPGLKEYSCDRFSFQYLGIYNIKTEETDFDNVIRRVNFRTDEKLKKRMVVKVSHEGKKKIGEIPSVVIRRDEKNRYEESSITIDGKKGLYFERFGKDNERTMFFFDGEILTAISLYSDFQISNDEDLAVVKQNFHWYK